MDPSVNLNRKGSFHTIAIPSDSFVSDYDQVPRTLLQSGFEIPIFMLAQRSVLPIIYLFLPLELEQNKVLC